VEQVNTVTADLGEAEAEEVPALSVVMLVLLQGEMVEQV
jgi:hypothetical protein